VSAATKPESRDRQLKHFIEKCARLQAEKNALELELSLKELRGLVGLAVRVAALESESDRINNFVSGHCVQRDEFDALRGKLRRFALDFVAVRDQVASGLGESAGEPGESRRAQPAPASAACTCGTYACENHT
jgi:hypothetical protein